MTGRTIGDRYLIEKLIGVGGMRSTVWRALQRPTDRPVAVKILPAANAEEAQRFERGARIASNLNHPHITTVHDYGITRDGTFYLVMELLEGHTLQHMLRQQALGLKDTLVIVDQILRALENAHALNVVHRDLKPANLFVTKKNDDIYFVKILDFGLAKLATTGTESASDEDDAVDPIEPRSTTSDSKPGGAGSRGAISIVDNNDITQAQRICGTPEYMAPEQILGAPLDQRTDLYALGVITYRMISGQLPFQSRVRHELYQQHLSAPPPPFPVTANAPEPLVRVMMKALAKRPAERFADASQMRIALREANRMIAAEFGQSFTGLFPTDASATKPPGSSVGSAPAPIAAKQRRAWLLPLATLLIGGGAATAIILSQSGPTPTPQVAVAALPSEPVAPVRRPAPTPPEPAVQVAPAHVASPTAPQPTVPQAAPAAVQPHGTVALKSTPAGAEVWREGRSIGTTPMNVVLPIGAQTLELRTADQPPRIVPVLVLADQEVALDIPLMVAASPTATAPSAAVAPQSPAITPAPPLTAPRVVRARVQARTTPTAETAAPGTAPTPQPVNVLGRDIVQTGPVVKRLGTDLPSPEPRAKILGK